MLQSHHKIILLLVLSVDLTGCSQKHYSPSTTADAASEVARNNADNPQVAAQPFTGKWTITVPEGGGVSDEIHLDFSRDHQVQKNDVITMMGEQGKHYSQLYKWSSLSDGNAKYLILDVADQNVRSYVWSFDKTMKFQWSVSDGGKYLSLTSGVNNFLGAKEDFLLNRE